MPGGYLNIVSVGNINVFLTGNPSKTFFKVTYAKYTNFGLQRFRFDYDGARDLRLTEVSKFTFKMKRYADLLMDTYVVVTLPDIWSPIYPASANTGNQHSPYEFRWIEQLGALMIKEIEILSGSSVLQRYSGQYIAAMVDRDFSETKKDMFNRMTGNVLEVNDPGNWSSRLKSFPYQNNIYPSANAPTTATTVSAEPSIRGRQLYIPINAWFTLNSQCALPLASMQYNELIINVTLRPIQEMFRVRDVFDATNFFPYVQPDFNQERFQMYRFLQSPPLNFNYENKTQTWNADVHILATCCFLSDEERLVFASKDQIYLVKDIFEYDYLNVTGSTKIKLESTSGMVSNWMFYFQRNDVKLRNEWWNFSNWAYEDVIPKNVEAVVFTNPPANPSPTTTIYTTGTAFNPNHKHILQSLGLLIEGEYRENVFPRGVYDFVEKYTRTDGNGKEGLYLYNFCLSTSPTNYQPSGAFNLSKFKNIELEFTTFSPPVDVFNSQYNVVCSDTGLPLAVSTKPSWAHNVYNYNLHVFEERYNILSFINGNCGLMFAR